MVYFNKLVICSPSLIDKNVIHSTRNGIMNDSLPLDITKTFVVSGFMEDVFDHTSNADSLVGLNVGGEFKEFVCQFPNTFNFDCFSLCHKRKLTYSFE